MTIGVDIVEIEKLARLAEEFPAFTKRTFSSCELRTASQMRPRRRAEYLASRFAAKEATLKALGTGLSSDLRLTEIETITSASGAPRLSLSGKALQLARRSGLRELHVSLSHESRFAIAFVVLQFGTRRIGGQEHFELKIECDPLRLLRSRR